MTERLEMKFLGKVIGTAEDTEEADDLLQWRTVELNHLGLSLLKTMTDTFDWLAINWRDGEISGTCAGWTFSTANVDWSVFNT